ncbi:PREDICTED: bromodomain-containing protein 4-like [Myotis brandtii]|uniref:bromodomain-containing protein 4-like n=1 Tax=Myotis brandtii TaxID=109478 RepID=UPI0007043054|nr:PREDICTED: bromodomain-containing protein 4-like [Myotis brandtii]
MAANEELNQTLRVIRYLGKRFLLNRLSSLLDKAGFYKQVQRWARRRRWSLSEGRQAENLCHWHPVCFRFSILKLEGHFSKHRFILEMASNRKCADCVITRLLVSHRMGTGSFGGAPTGGVLTKTFLAARDGYQAHFRNPVLRVWAVLDCHSVLKGQVCPAGRVQCEQPPRLHGHGGEDATTPSHLTCHHPTSPAIPPHLPSHLTCHPTSPAIPPHLPSHLTCHPTSPAIPPHLPSHLTCHPTSPAIPPHLPSHLTCHPTSPAIPPHLPSHLTCHPTSPAIPPHLPSHLTCHPTSPAIPPHLPSHLTCHPTSPAIPPHLPSHLTCHPTSPAIPPHLPSHLTCHPTSPALPLDLAGSHRATCRSRILKELRQSSLARAQSLRGQARLIKTMVPSSLLAKASELHATTDKRQSSDTVQ